jgi:putative spermidine/putrescine transport system substrate-binding protein
MKAERHLAVVLGIALAVLGGPAPARAAELVVQTWGSAVTEGETKAFYDGFEKAAGVKVVKVVATSDAAAKLEAQIRSGNIEWDIISGFSAPRFLAFAKRGWLEPVDYSRVPGAKALVPEARWANGVGTEVDTIVLAYNGKVLAADKRPQSWADFFNVEKFPGPRMMNNWGTAWGNIAIALLADGVARDKLVPMDLDRAFRKLDRVKPQVRVWFKSGAQQIQAFADGEVVMCACWDGRMQQARQQKVPIEFSWNQAVQFMTYWGIVKGSKNNELAHKFLEYTTDPKRQAVFTEYAAYSTSHPQAVDYLPEASRKDTSMWPANRARTLSLTEKEMDWVVENLTAINERWNAWISQ